MSHETILERLAKLEAGHSNMKESVTEIKEDCRDTKKDVGSLKRFQYMCLGALIIIEFVGKIVEHHAK